MMLIELTKPALVFPDVQAIWRPQALGTGSIVEVRRTTSPPKYWHVVWLDVIGRRNSGWLSTSSAHRVVRDKPLVNRREVTGPLSSADEKREAMWLFTNGFRDTTLVHAPRETPTPTQLRDSTMKTAKKSTKSKTTAQLVDDEPVKPAKATKTAKAEAPKPAPAKAKAETESRVPASQSAGQALLSCVSAPGSKSWKAAAKSLAAGETLSKTALETLRDNANESAAEARLADQTDVASNLALAIKKLRRVIRAA